MLPHVALCEEDRAYRHQMQKVLRDAGCKVTSFTNYTEAVRLLRRSKTAASAQTKTKSALRKLAAKDATIQKNDLTKVALLAVKRREEDESKVARSQFLEVRA